LHLGPVSPIQPQRYVPTRFLTPWFREQLSKFKPKDEEDRTKEIIRLARESRELSLPSPYHFTDDQLRVVLEPSWRQFFKDHYSVLMGNTRYPLIRFLQWRNPNVPGIVEKLDAPSNRDLGKAKKFFGAVRERLRAS